MPVESGDTISRRRIWGARSCDVTREAPRINGSHPAAVSVALFASGHYFRGLKRSSSFERDSSPAGAGLAPPNKASRPVREVESGGARSWITGGDKRRETVADNGFGCVGVISGARTGERGASPVRSRRRGGWCVLSALRDERPVGFQGPCNDPLLAWATPRGRWQAGFAGPPEHGRHAFAPPLHGSRRSAG